MADKVDKIQYERYEKMASFAVGYVRSTLKTTYEKYILGSKAEKYIYDNYIKPTIPQTAKDTEKSKHKVVTLEDIIAISTYIALSKESLDQALRTYRENRRVYKRNWFNSIKEEMGPPEKMKPKNPKLLRNWAEAQYNVSQLDRSTTINKSVQDFMEEKFAEIDAWRSDSSSPITDFFFLRNKPVKTLANGFVNDITYETIVIIQDYFGGNIEGFNTKFPTELTEYPIFSYRSTVMEFEPELISNELYFMQSYKYESEEEKTVGEVEVKFKQDLQLPSTATAKNLTQLMENFQVDLKQKELDMKDREIMTHLFNMINVETMNLPYITVDLKDFTRKVFKLKVPKQKHIQDLGKRLEKLKNYDYTITVRSRETGELIETSSIGILSYLYVNFKEGFFQFQPSEQWINTYVQKRYINILTDSYNSIESPQTKGIMMILQRERIAEQIKGNYTKTFILNYFRSHMKLQKMGNAALVKELKMHLDILTEKAIVVKSYTFTGKNSAVEIEFYPLDERETIAYDFPSHTLEYKNIVDGKFTEI